MSTLRCTSHFLGQDFTGNSEERHQAWLHTLCQPGRKEQRAQCPHPTGQEWGKARTGRRQNRVPQHLGIPSLAPRLEMPAARCHTPAPPSCSDVTLPLGAGSHSVLAQVPSDNKVRAPSAGLCLEQAASLRLLCFLSLFHLFVHSEPAARSSAERPQPGGLVLVALRGFSTFLFPQRQTQRERRGEREAHLSTRISSCRRSGL